MTLSARPELDRHPEYKPGLSIENIKRQYGLSRVIKLASNENPLGPSPKGLAAYKKCADNIFRYPESQSIDLRRLIASKFRLDLENVIVGNGSDEIIELLAKAYLAPFDEVIVSESAFLQYRIAANLMGARVVAVPLAGMKHDLKGMAAAVTPRTKLIFIANPNNPTGTYNTRSEVEQFLTGLPGHVLPVIDEAYFEYAETKKDYPSMIESFFRKKQMVVLRTFSKIYGLAGLRVGYGIASESIVKTLDKVRPPFNVAMPAQMAAAAALFDDAHIKKSVKMTEAEKEILTDKLIEMGFPVVSSAANFLLFKVHPWTGRVLFERMLRLGVIVRAVDEYGLQEYLRVTIGTPQENKVFLQALKEVCKEK